MNVKQLIVFFSITAAFFFFVIIYNVHAQNGMDKNKSSLASSTAGSDVKPQYTARPKPSGAPKIVKNETEAEELFSKSVNI